MIGQQSFLPVLLWTDALVFLLLAVLCVFAWSCARNENLRQGWGRVAANGMGMGSAVVLALFVGIGLLDSLHFRPALEKPGEGGKVAFALVLVDREEGGREVIEARGVPVLALFTRSSLLG